MFEESKERLLAALRDRWGDEPDWSVKIGKHGLHLLYRRDRSVDPPLVEIREVIDELFDFEIGVIIGVDGPQPGDFSHVAR